MDDNITPHFAVHGPRALELPRDLHDAIVKALGSVSVARWTREAQALSERYRAPRTGVEQPLATSRPETLGYLALVMPATYAQLRGAMMATAARVPAWAPTTMLDLGSGPGTALWAAAAQWPSLRALNAWEREPAFVTLGRELQSGSSSPAVRGAQWRRVDLRRIEAPPDRRYDLVVLGHVLNELPSEVRQAALDYAWRVTAGLLLIVEPGTSAAFVGVRAARDQLLEAGAYTIAPCPHDRPCPLVADWCHFPQRLVRPDFQRRARGAPSPWEDTKFSYAALARFTPPDPIWARVIGEPERTKALAEILVSTQAGTGRYRALKRHRDAFRAVRDLEWGDALPEPLPEPTVFVEQKKPPPPAGSTPDPE
jgi:ribosomal protein RSM22 (predicted rRNA methylase)